MVLNFPGKSKRCDEKTRVLRCIKAMKKNLNKSRCNYYLKCNFYTRTSGISISCFSCNSCPQICCLPIILLPRCTEISSCSTPPPSPACLQPSLNIILPSNQSPPLRCSPLDCYQPTDSYSPPTDSNPPLIDSSNSPPTNLDSSPIKYFSPPVDSYWFTPPNYCSISPVCCAPHLPSSGLSYPQVYYNLQPPNEYVFLPRCAPTASLCSLCASHSSDSCRPEITTSCPKLVTQSCPIRILTSNQRLKNNQISSIIKPFYIRSYELRGSKFLKCMCRSHFGLQDFCPRTGCNGSAACLTYPPCCLPSQFVYSCHAIPKGVLQKFYSSTGDSCLQCSFG